MRLTTDKKEERKNRHTQQYCDWQREKERGRGKKRKKGINGGGKRLDFAW